MSRTTDPKGADAARPERVAQGILYARVVRGPDQYGRWYWRVERSDRTGGRDQVATGWWHESAVGLALTQLEVGLMPEPPKDLRVRDLLELYLGSKAEQGAITAESLASLRTTARRILVVISEQPVMALSSMVLTGYVTHRLRSPAKRAPQIEALAKKRLPPRLAAPSTVQQEINLLRAAWAWAATVGAVEPRPFPPVTVPGARGMRRVTVNNRHTPTPEDVREVEFAFATRKGAVGRDMLLLFQLLALTACRISEIVSLTRGSVDLNLGTLKVNGKTGERTLPLVPRASALLSAHLSLMPDDPTAPVFAGKSTRSQFTLRLNEACAKAGVTRFSPHGLRRLGVTFLYGSGTDPGVAAAILGHSPEVALTYYRQVSQPEKQRAMEQAFRAMGTPGPTKPPHLHKTCTKPDPSPPKARKKARNSK
jgi:integrase